MCLRQNTDKTAITRSKCLIVTPFDCLSLSLIFDILHACVFYLTYAPAFKFSCASVHLVLFIHLNTINLLRTAVENESVWLNLIYIYRNTNIMLNQEKRKE